MIDRRIAKIKLRRGTEAERVNVVFEEGELVYAIDSTKLYVGDGNTLGGKLLTNKISFENAEPSQGSVGDIYFNHTENRGYIYDGSIWNLIGGGPDDYTIEYNGSFGLKAAGIQRDHLSEDVYRIGGGLSAVASEGIFINYDTTQFTVDINGVFKSLPNAGISAYNAGAIVNSASGLSANVDNDTVQILGNKLAVKSVYNSQLYGDITPNKVTSTFANSASGLKIDSYGMAIKTVSADLNFDTDGNLQLNPNQFPSQKSNNGYQVLPNKFIMQWGQSASISANQFYTVLFPLSTWSICYNVQVTMSYDSIINNNYVPVIKNITLSSFDVALDHSASPVTTETAIIYWTAIGYLTV
jgi:hypothetical protein